MKKLINTIDSIRKSGMKSVIDKRILEFREKGRKGKEEIFNELCFCILTANSAAERCIDVQCKMGNGFSKLPENMLQQKLKQCGARFHTKRAGYIAEARKYKDELFQIIRTKKGNELREWIVEHIKGLGYKEASHFLRNIGYDDYAIIDFHIIDVLVNQGLIERPNTLNKNRYIEIEELMRTIGKKVGLNLAELDLYMWYSETGKVLK